MPLTQILLLNLALIVLLFSLLWAISLLLRDASIIDLFWGLTFSLIAWSSYAQAEGQSARSLLLVACATVWGVRLSGYLAWRNWGKPEDHRYAAMRKRHGSRFPLVSLLSVFMLQAVLAWGISLPLQTGIYAAPAWCGIALIGCALWLIGLLFESIGDYQLAQFKANPANRGQVMRQGLWRFTRHPNYFGDFLVWWGFYLLAVLPESWWWTIGCPLLMSFLLIKVSGVSLLEGSLKKRVAGYEDYVKSTSAFLPLPPKTLSDGS